jgi:hypothetical protein
LMILAPLIVAKGQTDQAAPATKWVAGILSAADRRILTAEDVARIESYEGDGRVLHDMMRTILPLPRAIWYEATTIADRGMQIVCGYAIAPAPGGLDIATALYVPAHRRMFGPVGPARMTPAGIIPPGGIDDESWSGLLAAASIAVRAIMFIRKPP